jgi:uncharacterized protein YkwD
LNRAILLSLLAACSFLSNQIASLEIVNQDKPLAVPLGDDFEAILLDEINLKRSERGRPTLITNTVLMSVAEAHCVDMAKRDYFDHAGPEGNHAGERLDLAGYRWDYWGEVLARGSVTPEETLEGWFNSPRHKAVLLDAAYREVGLGFTEAGHYCWTVVLAVPGD